MATINILGVPHVYELTEPAPAEDVLVFIHGWLLSRNYWQPVIELLAADYQCLSYDLRGFGESQVERGGAMARSLTPGYSLATYAQDLVLLLKQLNITSAWLVGHSLGGSIALWGADQLPEQIKGVICLNAGGGIYLKEEFERFRSVGQQLINLRPRWLCHLPLLDLLFTRASVVQVLDRRWGRQRLVDFVVADRNAALGALLESTTEAEVHRLPQIVANLKQPVYFIAGEQDPVMEPKYVRHLASFHSLFQSNCANVVEIPDCGHMAMVEKPTAIAAALQTILSRSNR
jgi:2-succinyl-6-hydroxy-2,4-cyclohexadiene-1-carboxylate synthase